MVCTEIYCRPLRAYIIDIFSVQAAVGYAAAAVAAVAAGVDVTLSSAVVADVTAAVVAAALVAAALVAAVVLARHRLMVCVTPVEPEVGVVTAP